jgi:hypothetical protein
LTNMILVFNVCSWRSLTFLCRLWLHQIH